MKQENEDIARKMQYILNVRPVFNKEALFSDGTRYYRNPTEPKSGEKVIISFRTQKNNVDAVYLVSGDQKYKMKVYKTTKGFDYYGTKIVMPEEIFRYHFEIQYGWATCYYTEQGVCSELQEWAQFEIYPNYHTPDWAKGAVMYQIFVDRFRNGDPSNDVLTGEYSYIGEQVNKVDDWNRFPEQMDVRNFYGGDLQGVIGLAYGTHDSANGLAQVVLVAVLPGDDLLPVPLIHIDGVGVIHFLITADGIHVGEQAFAHIELVFLQRQALPLSQGVDYLGVRTNIGDVEGDGALDTVEVIVQTRILINEQGGGNPTQI